MICPIEVRLLSAALIDRLCKHDHSLLRRRRFTRGPSPRGRPAHRRHQQRHASLFLSKRFRLMPTPRRWHRASPGGLPLPQINPNHKPDLFPGERRGAAGGPRPEASRWGSTREVRRFSVQLAQPRRCRWPNRQNLSICLGALLFPVSRKSFPDNGAVFGRGPKSDRR